MKRKFLFFFFVIILFSAGFRLYGLNKVPPALFSDEADLGYQAYSFLKTGRDYFGKFLPVHFHSFADYRTPLYLYSAVPSIALFGLNEWGVRLPAAIFGILNLFFFFLLIVQLTNNGKLALVSTLILGFTPWHLHYSRAGFEITAMLFFLTGGFWLFFKELEKEKGFFGSALAFALTLYTYAPVKLFLPLLLTMVFWLNWKKILKFPKQKLLLSLIFFFLIAFPVIKSTVSGQANFRFGYLNIFNSNQAASAVNAFRLEDVIFGQKQTVGMKPGFWASVFHNKPQVWLEKFWRNYLEAFSVDFLFYKGDINLRHSLPNFGLFLPVILPFFLTGLIFSLLESLKNNKKELFWIAFFFLSPVAAALTIDGGQHASRLSFLILPVCYFTGSGFMKVFEAVKNYSWRRPFVFLIAFVFITNTVFYIHNYYVHYPSLSEKDWHYGIKEAVVEVGKIEKNYKRVYLSSSFEPLLIFYLFWNKYPPDKFNANNLVEVDNDWFAGKIMDGKYYFGRFKKIPTVENDSLYLLSRNEWGGDLVERIPDGLKLVEKINSFTGEPRFFLLETPLTK